MKINGKNQYHGAALAQIVDADEFTALNPASDKRGHYQINRNRRVLTKLSKADAGSWRYTFTKSDLAVLRNDIDTGNQAFVCLICGTFTICLLTEEDLNEVLDLDGPRQTIEVTAPQGKSMRVRSSKDELSRKVPHSSFPRDIF
jgi:hypothetical protein